MVVCKLLRIPLGIGLEIILDKEFSTGFIPKGTLYLFSKNDEGINKYF